MSEISEGTPIKTYAPKPVDVFDEIPVIGDYADKITVEKREKNNRAEFTIIENDEILSEVWLILAEYKGGKLESVKMEKGRISGDRIITAIYVLSEPKKIIDTAKMLLCNTTDDEIKYDVLRILAETYSKLGNEEMCKSYLAQIPELYFTGNSDVGIVTIEDGALELLFH